MKLNRGGLARSLDKPDPQVRFYLFHGGDDGQSRSHAQRLLASLGASRAVVSGASIRNDPALLADEAGAMSLFGGPRLLWVEPAGEEIAAGVEALLSAPAAESAVVAIAGSLRKTGTLLKLAETSPLAVAFASYMPEGQDAERMVIEVGRTFGLKVAAQVAARVSAACGNDQSVVRQEMEKLALYRGASTSSPKDLDHDAIDAVGADLPEGSFAHLADQALTGAMRELAGELAALLDGGADAIPLVKVLQRRLLQLAPARARIEGGESAAVVMASLDRSIFFKEKPLVSRLIQQWNAAGLATMIERTSQLERNMMLTPVPEKEALAEELIAIARAAQRR